MHLQDCKCRLRSVMGVVSGYHVSEAVTTAYSHAMSLLGASPQLTAFALRTGMAV